MNSILKKSTITSIQKYLYNCMVGYIQNTKLLCVHQCNFMYGGFAKAKKFFHLKRKTKFMFKSSLKSNFVNHTTIQNYLYNCTLLSQNHHTKLSILSILYYRYYLYDCTMVLGGGNS